jgi:tetratricopeptide (TPR) repeat protein
MIESKKIKNPFPGLRPFETDEYRLFFGREGQSDALIARLQRSHFLAVVGTSGSGKSSLVRAGLLPALRGGLMAGAGSGWRIAIMRPGSDPIGNLAAALAEKDMLLEAGGGLPPAEAEAVIEATLRRGSLGLVEVAKQSRLNEDEKLLVVVDQFEELFRFREARPASSTGDDASAFVKLLLEASQQHEFSIYVVPTMRSDFLGDCAQFQGLPEAINDGQYLIPRMTRDERRFAITGPVGVTRGKITEPLVNRLMNDVGDNPDQLPILQHALMRTWDHWARHRQNGEPIGLEHYEAVGTMADALSEHADEAYNELPNERSRQIAEILFKALTERGVHNREVRRPTRMKDICEIADATAAEVTSVIDVFRGGGRSFLMPPAGVALTPDTVIDISHESLIRNWLRLKGWVKEEAESARIYRRLAEAALDYRGGAGGLLDDVTLQYVLTWREKAQPDRTWAARYHQDFPGVMSYLEESRVARDLRVASEHERERRELETAQAFAEKQARSARRMRRLSAAVFLIMLTAMGTAVYAFHAKWEGKKSEEAAKKSERNAKVAQLAAQKSEQEAKSLAARLQNEKAQTEQLAADLDVKKREAEDALQAQELETKRANDQTRIAAENFKNAETARKLAEENEKETAEAKTRGEMMRSGLEASRREDSEVASFAFQNLVTLLNEAIQFAEKRKPAVLEDLHYDLGWALSHAGAERRLTGNLRDAIDSYEQARSQLTKTLQVNEAALKLDEAALMADESDEAQESAERQALKADKERQSKLLTLFETYHGLAHAYQENAPIVYRQSHQPDQQRQRLEAAEQEKARASYMLALAFQKEYLWQKGEIARGRINLARLYSDIDRPEDAQRYYASAIALELKQLDIPHNTDLSSSPDLPETVSYLKEQAEFYRSILKYDEAARAYSQLIDLQQKIYTQMRNNDQPEGYVEAAHNLANSFSDLADVYRAAGKPQEADDVFNVADMIQKVSLKLKSSAASIDLKLDDDLDKLGDAYVKIRKFDYADDIYKQAFQIRDATPEKRVTLWKSYDKLTRLYRENDDTKDDTMADDYNNLLIESLAKNKDQSLYIDSMVRFAGIYAKDSKHYEDAAALYKRALSAAPADDWQWQDSILYSLGQIYGKQRKVKERDESIETRLNLLNSFFRRLTEKTGSKPKAPINLLFEYLSAIEAKVFFLSNLPNKDAAAEEIYRPAFTDAAFKYVLENVYNKRVLDAYAKSFEHYQVAIGKLNNPAEVARVAGLKKSFQAQQEKLRQADEIQTQIGKQQLVQGPAAQ